MASPSPIIAGVLAAGGKSSRMGAPKPLLTFLGKTFLELQVDKLKSVCDKTIVVGIFPGMEKSPVAVVPDLVPGKGPLGALYTAMKTTPADFYLLLSIDLPLVSAAWLSELVAKAKQNNTAVVTRSGAKLHPLCAVYPAPAIQVVERRLLEGELRMTALLEELKATPVDFPGEPLFGPMELFNVNLPGDYQQLQQLENEN